MSTYPQGTAQQQTSPGGGFLTERVYRHLGVNLNCGFKSLAAQRDFAYEQVKALPGMSIVDEIKDDDANKPGFWICVLYRGRKVFVSFMGQPQYEEWLLEVSSKLGLSGSGLEKLANHISERVAKPKEEQKIDGLALRIAAGC